MAANTLANIAAATAAGYKEITLDRGASFAPATRRWLVILEKQVVGEPGSTGGLVRQYAEGPDQATAEATVLASLNFFRDHRYGKDSTAASKGSQGGNLTLDVS